MTIKAGQARRQPRLNPMQEFRTLPHSEYRAIHIISVFLFFSKAKILDVICLCCQFLAV